MHPEPSGFILCSMSRYFVTTRNHIFNFTYGVFKDGLVCRDTLKGMFVKEGQEPKFEELTPDGFVIEQFTPYNKAYAYVAIPAEILREVWKLNFKVARNRAILMHVLFGFMRLRIHGFRRFKHRYIAQFSACSLRTSFRAGQVICQQYGWFTNEGDSCVAKTFLTDQQKKYVKYAHGESWKLAERYSYIIEFIQAYANKLSHQYKLIKYIRRGYSGGGRGRPTAIDDSTEAQESQRFFRRYETFGHNSGKLGGHFRYITEAHQVRRFEELIRRRLPRLKASLSYSKEQLRYSSYDDSKERTTAIYRVDRPLTGRMYYSVCVHDADGSSRHIKGYEEEAH